MLKALVYVQIEKNQLWAKLLRCKANNNTVDLAMDAAKKALQPNVIIKAWEDTGLVPFSEDVIINNMKGRFNKVDMDAAMKKGVELVGEQLERARADLAERENMTIRGKARVNKNWCYSVYDLIEKDKQREKEEQTKEDAKRIKEAQRKQRKKDLEKEKIAKEARKLQRIKNAKDKKAKQQRSITQKAQKESKKRKARENNRMSCTSHNLRRATKVPRYN